MIHDKVLKGMRPHLSRRTILRKKYHMRLRFLKSTQRFVSKSTEPVKKKSGKLHTHRVSQPPTPPHHPQIAFIPSFETFTGRRRDKTTHRLSTESHGGIQGIENPPAAREQSVHSALRSHG